MLSTAADVVQLATAAPWVAVGVLSLLASAWVHRQARRAVRAVKAEAAASAERQGKRLGDLERLVGLLDLRRRQVEDVLLGDGLELPYWPPDGPRQRRPEPRRLAPVDDDEDQADDLTAEAPRVSVPPLPPLPAIARHRR